MLSGIGLFKGIMAKMSWLDQNQRVISKNVANADTPGFRPQTLKGMDFKSFMGDSLGKSGGGGSIVMASTDDGHFGAAKSGHNAVPGSSKQKTVYEASPDDNAVVLEEQLFKANENSINYQIATNLYRRNAGMLRMVIQGVRG